MELPLILVSFLRLLRSLLELRLLLLRFLLAEFAELLELCSLASSSMTSWPLAKMPGTWLLAHLLAYLGVLTFF